MMSDLAKRYDIIYDICKYYIGILYLCIEWHKRTQYSSYYRVVL